VAVQAPLLAGCDHPEPGTFEAIFRVLDASSAPVIGPTRPQLLVLPIRNEDGQVAGGLWGATAFGWLHVQMLFVPESLRGRGVGTRLMARAEAEARARGCLGAHVDAFSFQAAPFYRKIGYTPFGVLHDFPPGHDRVFFCKRFDTESAAVADAVGECPWRDSSRCRSLAIAVGRR
jgi:GNAT superfamily N-acetyltransferase